MHEDDRDTDGDVLTAAEGERLARRSEGLGICDDLDDVDPWTFTRPFRVPTAEQIARAFDTIREVSR